MLKTPTRSTTRTHSWCGPTALSALTGLPYDVVYKKMVASINRHSRATAKRRGYHADTWVQKSFQGVSVDDLAVAGKSLKLTIEWSTQHKGTTLLTFVRDHTVKGKVYLAVAANHYVVVKDGIVYDNTPTGPHPIDEYPRAKLGRITHWAQVRPRPEALA
jgi:hypothetical protein